MMSDNFQAIYDKLSGIINDEWIKLVYRADYGCGSWSMIFYLVQEDGTIKDCYSLAGVPRELLSRTFAEINVFLQEWHEREKWFVMTMVISSDGTFKTDFVYEDVSENLMDYYKEWEGEYLSHD